MAQLKEKLQLTLDSKESIKKALINKGAKITDETPFADYAGKVPGNGFSMEFSVGTQYGTIFESNENAEPVIVTVTAKSTKGDRSLQAYSEGTFANKTITETELTFTFTPSSSQGIYLYVYGNDTEGATCTGTITLSV